MLNVPKIKEKQKKNIDDMFHLKGASHSDQSHSYHCNVSILGAFKRLSKSLSSFIEILFVVFLLLLLF